MIISVKTKNLQEGEDGKRKHGEIISYLVKQDYGMGNYRARKPQAESRFDTERTIIQP